MGVGSPGIFVGSGLLATLWGFLRFPAGGGSVVAVMTLCFEMLSFWLDLFLMLRFGICFGDRLCLYA
jgi:hypothetical protein